MSTRTLLAIFLAATLPAHAQRQVKPQPAAPAPAPAAAPATPAAAAPKKAPVKRSTKKTPAQWLAGYMPKVKAALGGRWAEAVEAHMTEFAHGNLSVTFTLDAEGKVTAFAVVENSSNEAFAKFAEQFVRETAFEAPPAGALTDGTVEIPFTFTIL
jgi:hypothetical protein